MDANRWDEIKDRDPSDPLTQLEIVREKADREGVGISHQYRVLRDALESLQRIAELPERWHSKLVASGEDAIDSCAHELQQALPEGFRK